MSSNEEATPRSLPLDYQVPSVWTPPPSSMGGPMASMNQPTAGARHNRPLPRGQHALQLYSLGTPNGQKVTIMLEELGVDYDAWYINIMDLDQFGEDFVRLNPNSKIPVLLDTSTSPPLRVFESGSILLYLADKFPRHSFLPLALAPKTECINWLMWQMGTAPYLGGGFGHFYKYAPLKIEYAINRFSMETKRILDVLDRQLKVTQLWVIGEDYSIADMAIFPWIKCLKDGYAAEGFLGLSEYEHVQAWMARMMARDAVCRGLRVNRDWGSPGDLRNRHSTEDFN